MTTNGYGASFGDDENVLKLDTGDGVHFKTEDFTAFFLS